MSVEKSIGVATIPWVLLNLYAILNDKDKEFGYPSLIDKFNLALFSLCVHSGFTEASCANAVINFSAAWGISNGFLLFLYPNIFGAVYGIRQEREDSASVFTARRNYGSNLISCGVFFLALSLGADKLVAAGLYWLSAFLGFAIMTFITKDWAKQNVQVLPIYIWLLIVAALSGAFLHS